MVKCEANRQEGGKGPIRQRLGGSVAAPPIMRNFLFFLVVGSCLSPGVPWAQKELSPDVRKIIQEAPRGEDYPGAAAVYLLDRREFELGLDGTAVTTVHQIVKILSPRWLTDSSRDPGLEGSFVPLSPVVQIDYLDRSQKITIRQARVIDPDGTVRDVDAATAIQDRPRDQTVFSIYTDRRRQIDFRSLASVGSILELEYQIQDVQPVIPGHFWDRCVMQRGDPILLSQYILKVPHGISFATKFHLLEPECQTPQEQDLGSRRRYLWQRTNVPPVVLENLMPPRPDVTSWILVSSIRSWDQIAAWYSGMVQDKYDSNEAMQANVMALVKGLTDREEILKRIFYFAQTRVRFPEDVSLHGGLGHSATQVFAQKMGDCKDQATLLITLLRLAGVEAYPALLRGRDLGELAPDVPALEQFNHALVAVPRGDGSYIWLDPTSSVCPYGYLPWNSQGCLALVVRGDQGELIRTPMARPAENQVERQARLRLYRNRTLQGEVTVTFYGDFAIANRRWFQDPANPPEKWHLAFLNDVRRICSNALMDPEDLRPPPDVYDLNQPVTVRYRFRAVPYLDLHWSGASISFLPSVLDRWTAEVVTAERRTHALVLKPQVRLSTIEFELPTDYEVYDLPHPVRIDYPFARFEVNYRYENKLLTYQRRVEIHQPLIAAEQYQDVKQFFERIELEDKYTAVFLKEVGS